MKRRPLIHCRNQSPRSRRASGFSYIEALIAMLLIAVALVPALEALHGGIQGSGIHANRAVDHYRLLGKLEEVLAQRTEVLDEQADLAGGAGVASDLFSEGGEGFGRLLVYLAHYDPGAKTLSDSASGLILVRVQIQGSKDTLATLINTDI